MNLNLRHFITYKSYSLFICLFLYFVNPQLIESKEFQAIGTVNPIDYIPAQKEIATGVNGMVTTQHFLATRVGEKILNNGGNAYDASIAIAFTLAVVLPRA